MNNYNIDKKIFQIYLLIIVIIYIIEYCVDEYDSYVMKR